MKNSRDNEKIFERLAEVDDDLLDVALNVDNADKLEKYASARSRTKKSIFIKPAFRRAIVSAACFTLVIGLVLGGSFIHRINNTGDQLGGEGTEGQETGQQTNNDIENETQSGDIGSNVVELDSLDKINYYAAVKMTSAVPSGIFNTADAIPSSLSRINYKSRNIQFLSGTTDNNGEDEIETVEETEIETVEDIVIEIETNTETSDGDDDDYLFDLPFVITTAIYFETEITEDCEPLASLIGTGRADVVVTDLHVNGRPRAMITFKNGDRYFNCITQMRDLVQGINSFQSSIYIDGYDLKKDIWRCDPTSFIIDLDLENGEIISAQWKPYSTTPSTAPSYPFHIYENTVKISRERYSFSLEDLEDYYISIGMDVVSSKNDEDQMKTEELLITAGRNEIAPHGYVLWESRYDGIPGYWSEDQNEGVEQWLIPSLEKGGDEDILTLDRVGLLDMYVGDGGKVTSIKVYHANDEGKIVLFDGIHIDGTIHSLDWLDLGEWYVLITVEWQGDYIEEANMFESCCKEYFFKLTV